MQCAAERLAVTGSDSSSDLLEVMKINGPQNFLFRNLMLLERAESRTQKVTPNFDWFTQFVESPSLRPVKHCGTC